MPHQDEGLLGGTASGRAAVLRHDEAAVPDWWTSDEWATPPHVFEQIDDLFGPFDLDPCCRVETRKAPHYFVKADDGLARAWGYPSVFVNPPYSNPRPWIVKAIEQIRLRFTRRVVMLLPAATDTTWFHDLVLPHADVIFMRGRVKFYGWKGTPIGSPKAGTILAVFPKRPQIFVVDGLSIESAQAVEPSKSEEASK